MVSILYTDPLLSLIIIAVSLLVALVVWRLVFRRMESYKKKSWPFILLSVAIFIILSFVLVQLFAVVSITLHLV